jgi:hypothetical protein
MNCDHCGCDLASSGAQALLMLHLEIYSPIMSDPVEHHLCGTCSFELSEFLCPTLKDSESYQEWKREALRKLAALRN